MNLQTFYDFIMPELPGIQPNLVDLYLRLSIIEFCDETQVWVVDSDAIDIVAGTATYQINPPASVTTGADVSMVKWAWFDGTPLTFTTFEELAQSNITNWADMTAEKPKGYTQPTQDTLTLFPIPTVDYTAGLKLKMALRPSLTSVAIPDWIGNKWIQEFSYGAKAALMAMYGKPWSNPEGAAYYRSLFEAAKTRGVIDSNRNFTRANSRIQLPRTV